MGMMIGGTRAAGESGPQSRGPHVAEESYDPARAEKLAEMLRELARRITALDAQGGLLGETSALLKTLGDIRSELFRYEVRKTFDTAEIAEHRRIVGEAALGWTANPQDDPSDEEGRWLPPDGR